MPLSFVQAAQNFTIGSPTTLTVTISTSAGSLLVCFIRQAQDQTSTWTVADSSGQGNWTQTSGGYTSNAAENFRGAMHFIPNSAAATSVTATFSGAVTNPNMVVVEFSGAATSSVQDATVNFGSTGTTDITGGSLTTILADTVLILGVCLSADGGGFTQGSGYTLPANGASNNRVAVEYQIVSSIQTGTIAHITVASGQSYGSVFTSFAAAAAVATGVMDDDVGISFRPLALDQTITVFQ